MILKYSESVWNGKGPVGYIHMYAVLAQHLDLENKCIMFFSNHYTQPMIGSVLVSSFGQLLYSVLRTPYLHLWRSSLPIPSLEKGPKQSTPEVTDTD